MKWITTILFIANVSILFGQENLVPNPSFEEHSDCPFSGGQMWMTTAWHKVGGFGGISYYNECGTGNYGIPINIGGGSTQEQVRPILT